MGGSHRHRDRGRATETGTSGGDRRGGRSGDSGRRAWSCKPGARRRDLGRRPRGPREGGRARGGGATSGGESKSPGGKRAEPRWIRPAQRGATAATARPAPTWRLLRAAAPRVRPPRAPHLLAAPPPPAMSRTRAQRRPPAMTAARAGGGEAGARGWRRGASALPHPASPPPPPPGPLRGAPGTRAPPLPVRAARTRRAETKGRPLYMGSCGIRGGGPARALQRHRDGFVSFLSPSRTPIPIPAPGARAPGNLSRCWAPGSLGPPSCGERRRVPVCKSCLVLVRATLGALAVLQHGNR